MPPVKLYLLDDDDSADDVDADSCLLFTLPVYLLTFFPRKEK